MSRLAEPGQRNYLALIGDVRGSRHLPDRRGAQETLRSGLQEVERRHGGSLAARFAITLGDEFQGLIAVPAAGLAIASACEESVAPLRLRFGLGWGPLSTDLRPEALGMDGPCFHRAREAIARAKGEGRWIVVRGFDEGEEQVLDGMLFLMGAVRAGWTEKQARIVALRRDSPTQRQLARDLGIDPSTASKRLQSALYEPMMEAERAVSILLGRFAGGGG